MHCLKKWFRMLFGRKSQHNNVDNCDSLDFSEISKAEDQLTLSGCVVSDVGRVRTNNEDNFLLDTYINEDAAEHKHADITLTSHDFMSWHMFSVFDGMGGGEIGEVAANIAAKTFQRSCLCFRVMALRKTVGSKILLPYR